MKEFFRKLFCRPTAAERAAYDLREAQLDALAAAANLEHWQAQKTMLEARVRRLNIMLGQS